MSILQKLQPKFLFKHADILVTILERFKTDAFKASGQITRLSNPLMLLVIMTDVVTQIKKQFRSLALRVDFIND